MSSENLSQEAIMNGLTDLFNKIDQYYRPQMEQALAGYSFSEIACLEFIGQHEDSNVTQIAEALYVTRGAISKISKKLLTKQLVESYQKPDNKKEIYFRLTAKGQAINAQHTTLHQQFLKADQPIFEQLSLDEKRSIKRFVDLYNAHLDQELRKNK